MKTYLSSTYSLLCFFGFLLFLACNTSEKVAKPPTGSNNAKSCKLIQTDNDYKLICGQISQTIPVFVGFDLVELIDAKSIVLRYSSQHQVSFFDLYLEMKQDQFYSNKAILTYYDRMDPDDRKLSCTTELKVMLTAINSQQNVYEDKIVDNRENCKSQFDSVRSIEEIFSFYKDAAPEEIAEKGTGTDRMKHYIQKFNPDTDKLSQLNDIGYYLQQNKYHKEAMLLFEEVIKIDPKRTVAWLNKGDSELALNDDNKAKKSYDRYIELMKLSGKAGKIPKRLLK